MIFPESADQTPGSTVIDRCFSLKSLAQAHNHA